jgi:chemotaxis protein CheX
MSPDESRIRSIVRTVWSTQLGLEILDAEDAVQPSSSPTMTAAIHISGDYHGGIRLECSRTIVRSAASIMFDLPADQLVDDDERDVIGELANVVAGNIKALIPGTNSISLPTIVEGSDYRVSTLDVRSSADYSFTLDGESMTVTVMEHGS